MVEALTIVLAAGRHARLALVARGVAADVALAAIVVAALGPALTVIPIDVLRLVVGALLLVFGLQWLRKAILRASGWQALHDEDAIFARELARRATAAARERAPASTGTASRSRSRACCSRARGRVHRAHVRQHAGEHPARRGGAPPRRARVVAAGRRRARAARARAREHDEVRRRRDADDVRHVLGRRGRRRATGRAATRRCRAAAVGACHRGGDGVSWVERVARAVWEFVVGDDWVTAAGVVVALALTAAVAGAGAGGWWVMPPAVAALLALSLRRAR
jgi:hypothetical protein